MRRLLILPSLYVIFAVLMGVRAPLPEGLYLGTMLVLSLLATKLPPSGYRLFLFYFLGFMVFNSLRVFADNTGNPTSYAYPIDLDTAIFGSLPSAWLQQRYYDAGQLKVLDSVLVVVYLSYFKVHFIGGGFMWLFKRDLLKTYIVAILATLYLGLVLYYLLPTAPPWLAAENGHISGVERIVQVATSQVWRQAAEDGNFIAGSNDVGAMPSLHTALTMVIALMGWRLNRLIGLLGFAYVAAMGFALVYLGEHYVADVVVGIVTACLGVWVANEAMRKLHRTEQVIHLEQVPIPHPYAQQEAA